MAIHFNRALLIAALSFTLQAQADEAGGSAEIAACGPASRNVRLVTGAPYSALGTSETVSVLPNGSKVVRQNVIRQWRDSDGRTRSEIELTSIGGPTPLEINTKVTVIDDPAAGARHIVRPDGQVVSLSIVPCRVAASLEPDLTVGPPRPAGLPLKVSQPVRLGERKVDGETVTGSRVEATIPAGAMGNEQPVKMSAEQWYGKDLQVVVEATYKDPRSGETKYKLREIERKEPDASLFKPESNPMGAPAPQRGRP